MKKGALMTAMIAAAAVAYGTKAAIDSINREIDEETINSFINDQLVCDTLDGKKLMEWYSEKREKHPENTLLFLGKATQKVADMLAIGTFPENLDKEHTVFQAIINKETAEVYECRMISFSSMSPKVAESFGGKEYVFVNA